MNDDDIEIAARANSVEAAIRKARDAKQHSGEGQRIKLVYSFPQSISAREVLNAEYVFQEEAQSAGIIRNPEIIQGQWVHWLGWSFRNRRQFHSSFHPAVYVRAAKTL